MEVQGISAWQVILVLVGQALRAEAASIRSGGAAIRADYAVALMMPVFDLLAMKFDSSVRKSPDLARLVERPRRWR